MTLELTENVLRALEAHARADYPHECCGAIFGTDADGVRRVRECIRIENVTTEDQRRRFSISPNDYLRAELEAVELGLELLGFYHSHPDHPAVPSPTDRAHAVPGFSYPIVPVAAGTPGAVRSWRIADIDADYEEEAVTVTTSNTPGTIPQEQPANGDA